MVAGANHDRRAPADGLDPVRLPDLLAGLLVERADVGACLLRALVVLVDEDAVLVEDRRAGAAVGVGEAPDRVVPRDLAVEVNRHESVRAE